MVLLKLVLSSSKGSSIENTLRVVDQFLSKTNGHILTVTDLGWRPVAQEKNALPELKRFTSCLLSGNSRSEKEIASLLKPAPEISKFLLKPINLFQTTPKYRKWVLPRTQAKPHL